MRLGFFPSQKGCLTRSDVRQAPFLVSAGHGCAAVSGACGLRHDGRVLARTGAFTEVRRPVRACAREV